MTTVESGVIEKYNTHLLSTQQRVGSRRIINCLFFLYMKGLNDVYWLVTRKWRLAKQFVFKQEEYA